MLVFLRLLICAPHMNPFKLFIFLTPPYGAVTCLSWSILENARPRLDYFWCVYMGDSHQTMPVFCYFFCWVGSVDATLCNSLQEFSSHLLQSKEIINIIGPKCGDVSQRCFQTDATGLHLIGQLNKKLEGPWKNGVLIFFEMPQLIAARCPQCMDD